MALFDKKFDWYDLLVPGSQIPAGFGVISNLTGNDFNVSDFGGMLNDISGVSSTQDFNKQEAQKQRQFEQYEAAVNRGFNAAEAEKQRRFEEMMSSSAYQRSMADLKAAGLNPNLIYGTGGAASTPTGSAASGSAARGSAASSSSNASPLIGNFASILNSAANLMNSSTRQLANKRYSEHLNWKERDEIQDITNNIYDNAGKLIAKTVGTKFKFKQ